MIVEIYINNGVLFASNKLIEVKKLLISSTIIRNKMNWLKKEMLEKYHTLASRIPSTQGYNFYGKYLVDKEDTNLQKK